ncbi:hypothetical protein [Acinetobacter ursingii]|uniref:Uncharacterized protein n=1 Tax=Acinetobacter ursingii TaxID=108980 RepID=A0AA46S2G3_9GAMM|nr:hypothetical protein [Acinetobacter ursingii]UYF70527.1 hypothetical protein LSO60_09480 [Acinetobacter ursingii]
MIDLELERKAFNDWHFLTYGEFVNWWDDAPASWIHNDRWKGWISSAESKQAEIDALKAKLAKVESGEFVVVPKSEIGNYYFDDSECIYIDEPDSFLSELDVGEVCEVKRRDYFDLPTQYAAKVFIDIDNIEWRLFESELEAEIAANECKDKFWGEQGDGDE